MAVIPHDHSRKVLDELVDAGFSATFAESRGGMLRQTQHSIFIAVNKEEHQQVLSIIKENCRTPSEPHERDGDPGETDSAPVSAELGGAVVFTWDIDTVEAY
ncbi:MAG: cyclic-di-AMP receptor [Anaerolineales bacterium]|nr:cyclic-di-AMP receptor [Anaerolineales bacterium]